LNESKKFKSNPISRREFAQKAALGGIGFFVFAGLESCGTDEVYFVPRAFNAPIHSPLSLKEYNYLARILNVILPENGNGPGAQQVNAVEHICSVLRDKRQDPDENRLITNRLNRFISDMDQNAEFQNASLKVQSELVIAASETKWGNYWVSRLTTLVLEALLLDPKYNVNSNECGWKWLEHQPGSPRPTDSRLYPTIFETDEI